MITLGIIGVVTALTIPVLVQRHNEKVWTTSFLRVYSTLENAYKLAINDYGTFENWDGFKVGYNSYDGNKIIQTPPTPEFVYNAFLPYLNVNSTYTELGKTTCMPDKSYWLNGDLAGNFSTLKPAVLLASGECITFGHDSRIAHIYVDVNGKKGPNTLGKDQFLFNFYAKVPEKLIPYVNWGNIASNCNPSGGNWTPGNSCGYWISRYRNMDYLHLSHEEVSRLWNK